MGVTSTFASDVMSAEFMNLPEVSPPTQDSDGTQKFCSVQYSFFHAAEDTSVHRNPQNMKDVRERIRNHIKGNRGTNSKVASLVNRIESRLQSSHEPPRGNHNASVYRKPISRAECSSPFCSRSESQSILDNPIAPRVQEPKSPMPEVTNAPAEVLFATHDTWGILDTGATKTVMGSEFVPSFLRSVHADVRGKIRRCPCDVTFRFGNQGTLKSEHAMVVPICGFDLKIAVVPGATPFLVSNTLLRALGALVDTSSNQLVLPKHGQKIPLKLSNKGLYLVDMNMLLKVPPQPKGDHQHAETFAQESWEKKVSDATKAIESANDHSGIQVKSVKFEASGKSQFSPSSSVSNHMSSSNHKHDDFTAKPTTSMFMST